MDSSYRLEKVSECSTREAESPLTGRFSPEGGKVDLWSRANTHAVGSSGSMAKSRHGESLSLHVKYNTMLDVH